MNIYVRRENGWLLISDDCGHWMRYLYYGKKEALRKFKEEFGHKWKRGIVVVDYTIDNAGKEMQNGV